MDLLSDSGGPDYPQQIEKGSRSLAVLDFSNGGVAPRWGKRWIQQEHSSWATAATIVPDESW